MVLRAVSILVAVELELLIGMAVVAIHDIDIATDGAVPVVGFHMFALLDVFGATHTLVLLAHFLARLEIGDGESFVGARGFVVDSGINEIIPKTPDLAFTLLFFRCGDHCAHGLVGHRGSRAVTHIALAVLESTLATSIAGLSAAVAIGHQCTADALDLETRVIGVVFSSTNFGTSPFVRLADTAEVWLVLVSALVLALSLHAVRALDAVGAIVRGILRTRGLAGPFGRRSPAVFAGAARCLARTQETFVVTASHQSGKFGGTDLIVAIRVDFLHHHLSALVASLQAFASTNTIHERFAAAFHTSIWALAAHVVSVINGLKHSVFTKAIVATVVFTFVCTLPGISPGAIDVAFETFDVWGAGCAAGHPSGAFATSRFVIVSCEQFAVFADTLDARGIRALVFAQGGLRTAAIGFVQGALQEWFAHGVTNLRTLVASFAIIVGSAEFEVDSHTLDTDRCVACISTFSCERRAAVHVGLRFDALGIFLLHHPHLIRSHNLESSQAIVVINTKNILPVPAFLR